MEQLILLIQTLGYFSYVILFIIIFFESFPPTFFLPGDSLLFVTGFLASAGYLNMPLLIGVLFVASVSGYLFSYFMGEKLRGFILRSNDKYWFKIKHLQYTEKFYEKYGAKTLIIGRFVPIVRSFSPTLAGAVDMKFDKFFRYVLVGGFLWIAIITNIGFFLGRSIPNADKLLTPIVLSIIFVSLLPTIIEYYRKKREDKKEEKIS